MNRAAAAVPRKQSEASPAHAPPFLSSWHHRIGLLLASIVLLSLSFAPFNQFYLAWVGLAPWLLAIAATRSNKSAFAWGFASGWVFFLANMWWLWFVSVPGLVALTIYLGIFWGLAGVTVHFIWRTLLPLPVLRGHRAAVGGRAGERGG